MHGHGRLYTIKTNKDKNNPGGGCEVGFRWMGKWTLWQLTHLFDLGWTLNSYSSIQVITNWQKFNKLKLFLQFL